MLAPDKEDYSRQEGMVEHARDDLAKAIASLVAEGKTAHRALSSKRGEPDMDRLTALWRNVQDCEEGYDTARYDLRTAMGEDG
jgi:hypothetical protein